MFYLLLPLLFLFYGILQGAPPHCPLLEKRTRGKWVEGLGEEWNFPSDHLPIGMELDGVCIASWNILNANYAHWIKVNGQRLKNSSILKENIRIQESALTKRDQTVIEYLLRLLYHPIYPRQLLALQECSLPFISALNIQLPPYYTLIISSDQPLEDQNIFVYDSRVFRLVQKEVREDIFSLLGHRNTPPRSVTHIRLEKKSGYYKKWDLITTRLPAVPRNPAPNELAAYLATLPAEDSLLVALADMNFNEAIMKAAFETHLPKELPWILGSPYCTNIGLDGYSKAIDHFLIAAKDLPPLRFHQAEEVLLHLSDLVSLINP